MEKDAFVAFVESARLMLVEQEMRGRAEEEVSMPSWSWVCCRILGCLKAYSSGVTPAILLSDLLKAWLESSRVERGRNRKENSVYNSPGLALYKKQRQLRTKLSKIVTIDSIHEKRFISLDAVLEVVIIDVQLLSGTSSYILTLGDAWSTCNIDLYLHRKFYDLIDEQRGVLRKGRELRLTGCRLRTAVVAGSSQTRLLPTEYLVVILDEEQDEDAVLLGARFYSDIFSNIHVDLLEAGTEFCFYARLEKIGEIEFHPQWNHVKQQTLFLVDEKLDSIPFILWDEQVSLAGLFSPGSMIAVERPFISQFGLPDSPHSSRFVLEYGSASRLYTVPFIHREEQVLLESTSLQSSARSDEHKVALSQLVLTRDSQGSVDYCSCPVRLLVSDVRPKMSNISLYGVVRSFIELDGAAEGRSHQSVVLGLGKVNVYQMTMEDHSGSVVIQLSFAEGRRAEKLENGHTVFIAGLTSRAGPSNRTNCFWNEKDAMAQLVNITQLPALLTSLCLYQLLPLHQLSRSRFGVQVCRVSFKDIKLDWVTLKNISGQCEHLSAACSDEEVTPTIVVAVELQDRHTEGDGVCIALCFGQPAVDILQASAEDFLSWPEDEQAMYLYSLQKEVYLVALYDGSGDSVHCFKDTPWRIGQAVKLEL